MVVAMWTVLIALLVTARILAKRPLALPAHERHLCRLR